MSRYSQAVEALQGVGETYLYEVLDWVQIRPIKVVAGRGEYLDAQSEASISSRIDP